MPRLPTILVIGSQAISTRPVSSTAVIVISLPRADVRALSPGLLVAGQQLIALLAPLRLLVGRLGGEAAQRADDGAVQAAGRGRDPRARRLVHERHELVREAADAVDPAALGHIALHHRAPAAELDQALGRAVLGGEVALLVVPGAVA